MIFYVNEIVQDNSDVHVIGLFDSNIREGEGNFCGLYSTEFYINVTLVAVGARETNNMNDRSKFIQFSDEAEYFDRIQVGTLYYERFIEASTIVEAIEKFKAREWSIERYYPSDEDKLSDVITNKIKPLKKFLQSISSRNKTVTSKEVNAFSSICYDECSSNLNFRDAIYYHIGHGIYMRSVGHLVATGYFTKNVVYQNPEFIFAVMKRDKNVMPVFVYYKKFPETEKYFQPSVFHAMPFEVPKELQEDFEWAYQQILQGRLMFLTAEEF